MVAETLPDKPLSYPLNFMSIPIPGCNWSPGWWRL